MAKAKRAKPKAKPKGKHGGSRPGAGAPRSKLPDDVIARLGDCPTKPRDIRIWNARLLAEIQVLAMKGEIDTGLAATLRANAGAIERTLPPEPPPRRTEDDGDDDQDDDEEGDGPELEQVEGSADGLRVG
ncbi:MAG: hypothetical protein AB7O24_04315 [Kofleriaceae bacterium]